MERKITGELAAGWREKLGKMSENVTEIKDSLADRAGTHRSGWTLWTHLGRAEEALNDATDLLDEMQGEGRG